MFTLKAMSKVAVVSIALLVVSSWPTATASNRFTINLPKEWTLGQFNITDPGTSTRFNATYTDVIVEGLNNATLDSLSFDLEWLLLTATFKVPRMIITGQHNTRGTYLFIPFRGKGHFTVRTLESTLKVTSTLNRTRDVLQAKSAVAELESYKVRAYFDDLYTTHGASPVLDDMGQLLRKQINNMFYDFIRIHLLEEASPLLVQQVNHNLANVPSVLVHERTTPKIDQLVNSARTQIKASDLEPLALPDLRNDFTVGHIDLSKRSMHGLSTLFRSSKAHAHYNWEDESVLLETNLGFENLTLVNSFDLSVIGIRPGGGKGVINTTATSVTSSLKIRQPLDHSAKPELVKFEITKIGRVWVDLGGLGAWSGPAEAIINILSSAFESEMAKIASGPLREILQREVNNFHFFKHE